VSRFNQRTLKNPASLFHKLHKSSVNADPAHPQTSSTSAWRLLLFCATVAGALGSLSEWPMRWFIRAIFAVGCLGAGLSYLLLEAQHAGRRWSGAELLHAVKSAGRLLLWCLVATLGVRFLRMNALPYFSWDPEVFRALWDRRLILVPHIAAGMLAMLLGPAQ